MKKIVFINSPTQDYASKSNLLDYSTIPPLGLGYVATAAKEVVGKQNVSLIDAELLRLSDIDVIDRVMKINPQYVAINATTPNWELVKSIVLKIQEYTSATVIIGGPHAILSREAIYRDNVDLKESTLICVGDGEPTIQALLEGYPLYAVPNIMYKTLTGIVSTKEQVVESIDSIIDRDFFLNDPLVSNDKVESFVLSSRGCSYKCTFCAAPIINSNFHRRSLDSIKMEINQLDRSGVNYIRFVDDLLLANKSSVNDLEFVFSDVLNDKRVINFEATARTNTAHRFSSEEWSRLKAMGLEEIEIGIESGSQRILDLMSKKTNNSYVLKTIEMATKHNIKVKGFIMLGYPTETENDLNETVSLVKKLKNIAGKNIRFSPVITKAYPGTKIYNDYAHLFSEKDEGQLLELSSYLGDLIDPNQAILLNKRTRYNAVHTKAGVPIALSELTGGASLKSVAHALAKVTLISEGMLNNGLTCASA